MKKNELSQYLDEKAEELFSISQDLYNYPEISGKEKQSSEKFKMLLKEQGFRIHEFPEEELKYAFYAEYGKGHPVVGFLGEYDALPGLSQKGGSMVKEAVGASEPGHACGHNLIGTSAYASALAVKKYLEDTGKEGTVRFYGCPQEELLDGKVLMAKYHAFDGCDAAFSYHPWNANLPVYQGFLAMNNLKFHFTGISSHAGQAPEQGRSALDAVELANMGVNVMREHVISSARIHYVITNGGEAPNIVPKEASSWYYVRAPHRRDVNEITDRVLNCQKGAALMTDTTLSYEKVGGCYEILPNQVLFQLAHQNFHEMEMSPYTEEEKNLAKALSISLPEEQLKKDREVLGMETEGSYIHKETLSIEAAKSYPISGSSDIGDVSWLMPFSAIFTAAWPLGVNAHTWQSASASGSSLGQKGMLYAAKIMAGMAVDLMEKPEILREAQEEFRSRTEGNPYVSPLG
ncbi:amidohydrolase [Proteiniclasticum ruminis]|uniref:Aminobenzoyl-glutamate utilization protein B n=1 Tax=Proteiniclasticum ruminis TaxID=398199 RepID=A0A1G8KCV8_9CLOT|nr:amidohydrolase [Proteiniclasticum ruminis]SDI41248.1 aminobenzoyl-glutamate utilization protein B [Proteiniclasticum ruminis]